MNSVIIHTLRQRSKLIIGQGQTEGHSTKVKHTDMQLFYNTTFSHTCFLILKTPVRIVVFYMNFHSNNTPQYFAELYLFYQIWEKTYYTTME